MKIASQLRRVSSSRSVGRCSDCQALLSEGMVVDAEGRFACLACSILQSMGLERMRPALPASAGPFSLPRRADRIPGLAN